MDTAHLSKLGTKIHIVSTGLDTSQYPRNFRFEFDTSGNLQIIIRLGVSQLFFINLPITQFYFEDVAATDFDDAQTKITALIGTVGGSGDVTLDEILSGDTTLTASRAIDLNGEEFAILDGVNNFVTVNSDDGRVLLLTPLGKTIEINDDSDKVELRYSSDLGIRIDTVGTTIRGPLVMNDSDIDLSSGVTIKMKGDDNVVYQLRIIDGVLTLVPD